MPLQPSPRRSANSTAPTNFFHSSTNIQILHILLPHNSPVRSGLFPLLLFPRLSEGPSCFPVRHLSPPLPSGMAPPGSPLSLHFLLGSVVHSHPSLWPMCPGTLHGRPSQSLLSSRPLTGVSTHALPIPSASAPALTQGRSRSVAFCNLGASLREIIRNRSTKLDKACQLHTQSWRLTPTSLPTPSHCSNPKTLQISPCPLLCNPCLSSSRVQNS